MSAVSRLQLEERGSAAFRPGTYDQMGDYNTTAKTKSVKKKRTVYDFIRPSDDERRRH